MEKLSFRAILFLLKMSRNNNNNNNNNESASYHFCSKLAIRYRSYGNVVVLRANHECACSIILRDMQLVRPN
jgi:hypothetical protein